MLEYLHYKKQFMPPADNHRALIKKSGGSRDRAGHGGRLPDLQHAAWGHQTQQLMRSQIRSQHSLDSSDQRITQWRHNRNYESFDKGGFQSYLHQTDTYESQPKSILQSAAKARKELDRDAGFQTELRSCLKNLEQMPKLRQKVFEKLGQVNQQWADQKGQEGMIAGMMTRKRLVERRREIELQEDKRLDEIIEMTAQKSALQAINLSQLLKKKWTEETNAYQIISKIDQRKRKRLNDLVSNRYII